MLVIISEFLLCCVYDLIQDDTTGVVVIHYSLIPKGKFMYKKLSLHLLLLFFLHSMLITWVMPLSERFLNPIG